MISQELIEKAACLLLCEEERYNDFIPPVEWAAKIIVDHKHAAHYGDCTNEAQTCLRCQSEEYIRKATNFLTAILPDIRKEVLEEAAKVCDARVKVEKSLAEQDDESNIELYAFRLAVADTAEKLASRIRSLMEKEE